MQMYQTFLMMVFYMYSLYANGYIKNAVDVY